MIRAAVITSTIGRPELRQCIESVRAQLTEAKVEHYVFANGERHHDQARRTLQNYPNVNAFYLPDDTGDYGKGPSMADVFAAGPFLTTADWIFYLDDDNFYDPNHVESVLRLAAPNELEWAYALRRWVNKDGSPICDDNWCSLGHYTVPGPNHEMVDNSCFAVKRSLAKRLSLAWTAQPIFADRCFFMALKYSGTKSGCTGLSTVNYRIGTGTAYADPQAYLDLSVKMAEFMPDGFPWRKPAVF